MANVTFDSNALVASVFVTIEKELQKALQEKTGEYVEKAISEFNETVTKCKENIFNQRQKLEEGINSMLKSEINKATKEIETEMTKLTEMRKELTIEMNKMNDEYSKQISTLNEGHKKQETNLKNEYDTQIGKMHRLSSELKKEMENEYDKYNKKLSEKMNESRKKYENFIADIENQLFVNPNTLLKRIERESKLLNDDMRRFGEKQKEWNENDKRLARYHNVYDVETMQQPEQPLENPTDGDTNNDKDEDSVTVTTTATYAAVASKKKSKRRKKRHSNNSNSNSTCTTEENIETNYESKMLVNNNSKEDNEFVTIEIDNETFITQRGTLTQVKGSLLEKYFHACGGCLSPNMNGVYRLDANPTAFKQILHLLRLRRNGLLSDSSSNSNSNSGGNDTDDDNKDDHKNGSNKDDNSETVGMKIVRRKKIFVDASVYHELEAFDLLDIFLPYIREYDTKLNGKSIINNSSNYQSEKMANENNISDFIVYRSKTQNTSNYFINWDASGNKDVPFLIGGDTINTLVQINNNDWSRIDILQPGYYRITTRFVATIGSGVYARLHVNGSAKQHCYQYGYSTAYDKTFYFNDILLLKSNDYIQIYLSDTSFKSNVVNSTYLCIEKISTVIENKMGIWQSSSSSSDYRLWNNAVKNCNLYELKENNRDIYFKKCGIYRVSGRLHTNYTSSGSRYIRQEFYQGISGSTMYVYNYQSSASSGYQCHMVDSIVRVDSPKDYIRLNDCGYETASSQQYDEISIIPVSQENIGLWKSNTTSDDYKVWDYGGTHSQFFETGDSESSIVVKQSGYYRICAMITTKQSGDGQVSMYINGSEYCISKMGCYDGTYYHSHFINEIVHCNKDDKIRFYTTQPYDSKERNTLFVERLHVE